MLSAINPYNYIGTAPQQINIAYDQVDSINDLDHPNPKIVTKLVLIHSKLQSLAGIQKYTQLVTLNLKFNNLQNADQILLIPNKKLIRQLNLQGNTIQYYSLCTYASLRAHGFTNLVILNNKDYSKWGKNKKKTPSMHIIHSKLGEIQKSMSKTLKRTIKNNVVQKYKFLTDSIQPQQQETSRYSSKQVTTSSNQKTPLKQISLSNVNMVKSFKNDKVIEPQQKARAPQLFINPVQFDQNSVSHIPITQPTATFAAQKQRQNLGVPFRKTHRNDRSIINTVYQDNQNTQTEDYQDIYQLSEYLSNNVQRQSFSRTKASAFNGNNNKSTIEDLFEHTQDYQITMVEAIYLKGLQIKCMKALKSLLISKSKSADMPCQRRYV